MVLDFMVAILRMKTQVPAPATDRSEKLLGPAVA
jgi:hypothetical protein